MKYTIRIKRQESKGTKPFWQEFEIEVEDNISIATVLNELNSKSRLTDKLGDEVKQISWECGCMEKSVEPVQCALMVCQDLLVRHF